MTTHPATPVRVSPLLAQATAKALQIFADHWPRAVKITQVMQRDSESRDRLILQWARALMGVTLDAIPDAAQRWIADPQHAMTNGRTVIPTLAHFVRYAKDVDRQYYRIGHRTTPMPNGLPGKASELSGRALEILGTLRRVAEVTDELLRFCPDDPAARQRVRANRFSKEEKGPFPQERHYWEAVEIVRLRHADAIEREAPEREARKRQQLAARALEAAAC